MGLILSIINESFPPKSKFSVEDIPDLSGKVMIVTGANSGQYASSFFHCPSASKLRGFNQGIGKETARVSPRASHFGHLRIDLRFAQALLAHNAKVYIAARSQAKAEEAIEELKEDTGKEGIFLRLDLSDLKAIKAAAEEFYRCVGI
jgi:NAD(P)-dependent dehydrogenase (short-subunit alcohol dehydrogenase family)